MNQRFIRRNRVDERLALCIAAGSGAAATLAGAAPTGNTIVDIVLVWFFAGAVVWAAASAQWWAVAGASGLAAVFAFEPIATAIAAVGFLAGLDVGTWRRDQTVVRALVGGVAVNVLIRSQLDVFFGASAMVGIAVSVALFVLGVIRRPSRIRRTAWMSAAGVGVVAVVALLTVGLAAVSARPDISSGASTARQGVSALNTGDYEGAAELFEQASASFGSADQRLGGLLAAPGRLVPAVAQNLSAASTLASSASEATAEAAGALRQIDISQLSVSGGQLDLGAVRSVEAPLLRVHAALSVLSEDVDDVGSPWLLGRVDAELDEFDEEFASNEPRLANALAAVRLAPQMLGETDLRRYLVLFTSPAEARGLGGFVGSFAVLEAENGRMSVGDFGRTEVLNEAFHLTDCSSCPEELIQHYGKFGFTNAAGGAVGSTLVSNVTMSAHFPDVAEALTILYEQGRGNTLDGVAVMDPYVVQALMRYSGSIDVPAFDTVVQPNDAANFILRDQYVDTDENNATRVEALDELGTGALAAVLTGSLPDPTVVARDLGPLVAERRLLMWTTDAAEQALLDDVGMLGAIPEIDPVDGGFSVSVTNASASKIDVFLDRTVDVEIVVQPDGTRSLVGDVTYTNNAPTSGLSNYVIGNSLGEPDGFSRLYVTFYGPSRLSSATQDGENIGFETWPAAGWMSYSRYLDLPSGASATFRLEFALDGLQPEHHGDDGPVFTPTIWEQPLATRTP